MPDDTADWEAAHPDRDPNEARRELRWRRTAADYLLAELNDDAAARTRAMQQAHAEHRAFPGDSSPFGVIGPSLEALIDHYVTGPARDRLIDALRAEPQHNPNDEPQQVRWRAAAAAYLHARLIRDYDAVRHAMQQVITECYADHTATPWEILAPAIAELVAAHLHEPGLDNDWTRQRLADALADELSLYQLIPGPDDEAEGRQ